MTNLESKINSFKINKSKKNNRTSLLIVIIIFIVIFLVLMPIWPGVAIDDFLFNHDKNVYAEYLKLIGGLVGGCLILWGLWINNNRVKEQTRQNNIAENAQINTRFKDAALLLGSNNTSSILSGIHALHQIAVEVSNGDENHKGYIKVVHNILCAFIRENSDIENKINKQPQIVIQTVVDFIFKDEREIYYYADLDVDLQNCVFKSIDFIKAKIKFTNFTYSYFNDCHFNYSTIDHTKFNSATMIHSFFDFSQIFKSTFIKHNEFSYHSDLNWICFNNAIIEKVSFNEAIIQNSSFESVHIDKCDFSFSNLSNLSFNSASLFDSYFNFAFMNGLDFRDTEFHNVTFSETLLKGRTYDDIRENSYNITKK